jgi:hypothetical protein
MQITYLLLQSVVMLMLIIRLMSHVSPFIFRSACFSAQYSEQFP